MNDNIYERCPCGSDKKFKFCCYEKREAVRGHSVGSHRNTRRAEFPVDKCFISRDWKERGLAHVLVVAAIARWNILDGHLSRGCFLPLCHVAGARLSLSRRRWAGPPSIRLLKLLLPVRLMKLVLLGTTGYHPNDRRHTACLMLPEVGVVLDAGTAMYRVRECLATPTLDVFITHAHLDHIVGLTYLFDILYGRDMQRVTVHGQAEKLSAIQEHLLSEAIFPVQLPCQFAPLERPVPLAQKGRLTYFQLDHPGGSVGFRLDWPGSSMAYVTDTTATPDAAYLQSIRGVDVLVHECYFGDAHCEQCATDWP